MSDLALPSLDSRLPRSFYDRPTKHVAQELLGKFLVHRSGDEWVGGMIVETEAYLAEADLASHSSRGRTPRNASMFDEPGTLYVYSIHAKVCMNMVTEASGRGAAVLIRALEPIWGIASMQRRRGYDDLRRLTRGPAMLCQAIGIERRHDGIDLVQSETVLVGDAPRIAPQQIESSRRIGISRAQGALLRFCVHQNRYLSRSGGGERGNTAS